MLLTQYRQQRLQWPETGRHILAQFDAETVVVYQAYRPEIGLAAARGGSFVAPFRFNRMSWIKPNFLWMMHRSGWGRKEGQEVTLAVHIHRWAFDRILATAVPSSFNKRLYPDEPAWRRALRSSEVRLQWDPDHEPGGQRCARRAVQLGLRGQTLRLYASEWVVHIDDISELVRTQRTNVGTPDLMTPREAVYPVRDPEVASRLGLADPPVDGC
jgi:hypothetical protein